MTSVYFDSTASSGYVVTTDTLKIGPDGYIGGAGVSAASVVTIDNEGTVHASSGMGVDLSHGGLLTNEAGASIFGPADGVYAAGGAATVDNYGSIASNPHGHVYGVDFAAGGSVNNHLGADIAGSTDGVRIRGGAGTVTNAGTITGNSYYAVHLEDGGTVTNAATGTLSGGAGVYAVGAATSVTNDGSIAGGDYAINLKAGGFVSNGTSANIYAEVGVKIGGSPGTVINYGTVTGYASDPQTGILYGTGVVLFDGGDVTNTTGATISGRADGIVLFAASNIVNEAGAKIVGTHSFGIYLNGGGTVTNAGTISSTDYGIQFVGNFDNLVIADPGAVFQGKVGGSGTNVLELAAGSTAGAIGTIAGLGTSFIDFGTVKIDSGASWHLAGTNSIASGGTLIDRGTLTIGSSASLVNSGTIKVNDGVLIDNSALGGAGTIDITNGGTAELLGAASGATIDFMDASEVQLSDPTGVTIRDFAAGDTIDLTGLSFSPSDTVTYSSSLHEIIVYGPGSTTLATLGATDITGTPTLQQDGNGTDIVVCYLRGTRILTEHGEIAVEDLRSGMRAVTLSGRGPALKPVTWIGHRRMDAARHQRPDEVYPVRIMAGALGENTPHRDLLISPGHAVFVEGVLIPAQRLVNGETIIQDRAISEVEYFHIELEQHDLLLAEGLPAESYFDSGNRRFFANHGGPVELHAGPDDERVQAVPRFRLSNAGNGVSEERRRRVEQTAGRNRRNALGPGPARGETVRSAGAA